MEQRVPPAEVSIVVPVRNEAGNIEPLIREIEAALSGVAMFEVIYVDDGSTDGTPALLASLAAQKPFLQVRRHEASCGQSSAVRTGARAARGAVIVTLD